MIGPANLGLALPKGSPLLEPLNHAIMELRGNGVIDQLRRRWTEDLNQCFQLDLAVRCWPSALQLVACRSKAELGMYWAEAHLVALCS